MSRGFHSKSDFLVNTYVHTFEPLSCRFMHENGDAMTALPQEGEEEDVTDYLLNNTVVEVVKNQDTSKHLGN